jgi:nitrite reductase (NADH) large subunit
MREKLVLIGNGMAGMRTIDELLKLAPNKYDISVLGAEPHGNYNRIMLSPVLAGDKTIDDIMTHDLQWYKDNDIALYTNAEVKMIDRVHRKVITEQGIELVFDRLILATGSNPFMLPILGHDLDGVISFRDISDVNTMLETAKTHKKAVVIGGGLLGLEAANGLMLQGMDVTVVHKSNTLMNQQLDITASTLMKTELEAKGLHFLMGHVTASLTSDSDGRVTTVKFDDGSEIATDLVVMAIGIRPNITLARTSGLQCERGILVDDTMQTYTPNIYAVGECVQHRSQTFGLVAPLYEQARVCANHLADMGIARYISTTTATQLKVTGINLFSAGDFKGDSTTQDLVYQDPSRFIYKKIVLKANKIVGIVLYGDTRDGQWYFSLLNEQQNMALMRKNILFGRQYCEQAA